MKKALPLLIIIYLITSFIPVSAKADNSCSVTLGNVIYSENFDNIEDGTLPEGYRMSFYLKNGGTCKVENGKLVIDATNVELGKVLLPESLDSYGNYKIEADINFVSSKDANRWASIVYRQKADDNYYQMCVRRNTMASNGVEFAERYGVVWNVMNAQPAKVKIDTTPTHISIAICGDTLVETVSSDDIITARRISIKNNYKKVGAIGFQANYSVVEIDNIVVTECTGITPPPNNTDYTTYDFAGENIISRGAIVAEPENAEAFNKLFTDEHLPNNIVLAINKDGYVDALGASFPEIYEKIKGKIVPVIKVSDADSASWISAYLKTNKIIDALVCSSDPELVTSVRKAHKKTGGVLDCTSVTDTSRDSLNSMIWTANQNYARICLISGEIATKETVEYMQKRLITVWVTENTDTPALLHRAIQTGANGIVTDDSAALYGAYGFYADDINVLVRNPLVIGHRGLPSVAPENTLDSAKEAVKAGVDVIELDVRLTKDGHVVIYHDNGLESLTTGKGDTNKYTLDEIKKLTVLKSGSYGTFDKYKKSRIPTLDEYFEAFKNDDVLFFIEIKENNNNICPKTAEVIEKYGMKDRCVMITFNESMINSFQRAIPGISCGFLMNEVTGPNCETVVQNVLKLTSQHNATYNASSVSDPDVIRALMYRGVTTWPWTYGPSNTRTAYLNGVGGITTDCCNLCSDLPVSVSAGKTSCEIKPGSDIVFTPSVLTRTGKFTASKPELVIVDGSDCISVNGDTVTAVSEGTAYVMYRLTGNVDETPDNEFHGYTLYSDLIEITISKDAPAPRPDRNSLPLVLACSAVGLAAVVTAAIIISVKHKKKG